MSQFPPPQQPPINPGYPGYPGQPMPQPKQGNGPAVASLICGILGCVPAITGLLAIILGFVGIRKTRNPNVGGKGLAIAGLILGFVSLAGWATFGGFAWWAYNLARPLIEQGPTFVKDLNAGNSEAIRKWTASNVTEADIQRWSQMTRNWGSFQSAKITGVDQQRSTGTQPTITVKGEATFAKSKRQPEPMVRQFEIVFTLENNQFKIKNFAME